MDPHFHHCHCPCAIPAQQIPVMDEPHHVVCNPVSPCINTHLVTPMSCPQVCPQYNQINMTNQYKSSKIDRLNRISEHLDNISNPNMRTNITSNSSIITNITIDQPNDDIENRIRFLYNRMNTYNQPISEGLDKAKDKLMCLVHYIEQDRQDYINNYDKRKFFINRLEQKINEKLEEYRADLDDMEARLCDKIDKKSELISCEILKEKKDLNESVNSLKYDIENTVPKIISQMNEEQKERIESDNKLMDYLLSEFNEMHNTITNEKNIRKENEEAFKDMIQSVINKVKTDLENEKVQREAAETKLLNLVEETCNKLDNNSYL